MPIRVMIVDDHKMMRDGLASLLADEDNVEVIASVGDGRSAVTFAKEQCPDIVVMDIGMEGLNGIDATRQIRAHMPEIQVIALSMHTERRFVVDMLRAGAAAYLDKNSAFEELAVAIRKVQAGERYLSPSVAGAVIDEVRKDDGPASDAGAGKTLTRREREVLQLVAEGKSSKEIAVDLHISINTVIHHRQNVMDKLGLRTVAELTKYAVRTGLTQL